RGTCRLRGGAGGPGRLGGSCAWLRDGIAVLPGAVEPCALGVLHHWQQFRPGVRASNAATQIREYGRPAVLSFVAHDGGVGHATLVSDAPNGTERASLWRSFLCPDAGASFVVRANLPFARGLLLAASLGLPKRGR